MKKVLFIATVQSHIMNFHIPYLKYWKDKGYEVHVATNMDREKYRNIEKVICDVKWNHIDFDRNPFCKNTLISLSQLIKLMKINRYELVHVHTPVGGILGRLAAKISNTKNVVYTAHGFHFYKGAPIKNWLIYYPIEKIIARYTDIIITMNEEDYQICKSRFRTRIKGNIFKVNGVGIDLKRYNVDLQKDFNFKAKLGFNQADFIITVVAELSERKNHIQLIKSIEKLKDTYPDIKALFVGDGCLYDDIKEYIENNRMQENIILLGFRNDVERILNISDVLALFSYQEGLPKNIMEGMVAGKPIICTNIRGNKELVKNGINGYLVDVNDIDNTINRIEYMYKNREEIKQFGEKSKMFICEYSIENVMKDIDNIYKKIIVSDNMSV